MQVLFYLINLNLTKTSVNLRIVYRLGTACVERTIDDSCSTDSQCLLNVSNSHCEANECQCDTGLVYRLLFHYIGNITSTLKFIIDYR